MRKEINGTNDIKKPYISPKLFSHGSIKDITKAKHKVPKRDGTRRYSAV